MHNSCCFNGYLGGGTLISVTVLTAAHKVVDNYTRDLISVEATMEVNKEIQNSSRESTGLLLDLPHPWTEVKVAFNHLVSSSFHKG